MTETMKPPQDLRSFIPESASQAEDCDRLADRDGASQHGHVFS